MKEFLYLFRGDVDPHKMEKEAGPEAWQQHMMKWKSWMESLASSGKYVGGQPLAQGGTVVTGSGRNVTDGPFVEGKDIINGYLHIRANDLKEASELAKGCPILDIVGSVEVREMNTMGM
jgi:hypothetical protein